MLERTPGFYNSRMTAWEGISNRGFVNNDNTNYLLLIDGVPQDNHAKWGMNFLHIFPLLDNVKRIEILRGPGSTLWGIGANAGLFHIITKDADDLDNGKKNGGFYVKTHYEIEHEQKSISLQFGKVWDQGDLMVSLLGFDSNAERAKEYWLGATEPELTDFSYQQKYNHVGAERTFSNWDYNPSYDAYLKANYQDFGFKLKRSQMDSRLP